MMSEVNLTISGTTSPKPTLPQNSLTDISNLFLDFDLEFCLELSYIDEVRDGKLHVVKEIVKSTDEVQVFCKFPVKSFVPVRGRAIHANEAFKALIEV